MGWHPPIIGRREPCVTERHPFYGKCGDCGHIWPVIYLPMDMRLAAKIMGSACCPKCGADSERITPAKQVGGKLNEEAANGEEA